MNIPNDEDIYRMKSEEESFINNNLTKFKNEIIQKLNNTYNRYTLKDINNLFNNKATDIEFFAVDDVYEIINELFSKYYNKK